MVVRPDMGQGAVRCIAPSSNVACVSEAKTLVTLSAAVQEYRSCRVTEHYLRPNTVAEYSRHLDSLEDSLGEIEVGHLRHTDVQRWISSVAPGSAPSAFSVLSACFRWCEDNGFPGLAVFVPRRRPKRRRRERALTDDEYRRLWAGLSDPSITGKTSRESIMAIRLTMLMPLRRSEVVALPWVEVDLHRRRLFMHETKVGDAGIPLPPLAARLLDGMPRRHRYVFPGRYGRGHIHDTSLGHAFTSIASRLRLNDELTPKSQRVTLHTLRHAWMSKAARDGVPPKIAQAIGNFSSEWMADHYTHLYARDLEDALASMERGIVGGDLERAVAEMERGIVGQHQLGLFDEGGSR